MNGEAKKIIERLGLTPHIEGGWYRLMWSGETVIPSGALPARYNGERKNASLIYYLLEGSDVSSWHKLKSDEIWAWHSGGSLKMTLGGVEEKPLAEKELFLGPRYDRGECFHIIAPALNWQMTSLVDGVYALVSCIVSPAFHPDDVIQRSTAAI
jgi:predicted cupin superfamily sugar epimerase